jgi:predicted NAD/FAD-dependent oxidoreductase
MMSVMRNVVIIGAGLSGLSAAYELSKLGQQFTMIEVKPTLGGSIKTVNHNGFIFDQTQMLHTINNQALFDDYLMEFNLLQDVHYHDDQRLSFDGGTDSLIREFSRTFEAPIMQRMAVSTIGQIDQDKFGICLENGMLLDAKSVIVATPARYAERIFHTLNPQISYQLLDYRYDTITRVSFGYENPPEDMSFDVPEDSPIVAIDVIKGGVRIPSEQGIIVQVALRMAQHDLPQDPVGEIAALMGWELNPQADYIATWEESDPSQWRLDEHIPKLEAIQQLLPRGVAIANSDFVATRSAPTLDDRLLQGVKAVEKIMSDFAL